MKQMLYDLDYYVDEKLSGESDWCGDVADMVDIVDSYREVAYDNWNTIRRDYCVNLANHRRKMIYADNKEAWLIGRVEFLEKVIKQKLGDDFWNEYCKELD